MFNWLFKWRKPTAPPSVAPPAAPAPAASPAAARRASGSTRPSGRGPAAVPLAPVAHRAEPAIDWEARLAAAANDDAALLALAGSSAPIGIRTSAVAAIVGIDTLKQGEIVLRANDRRVHRLVKQRLAAALAVRRARESADALVQQAEALLQAEAVPVNHLVALDRAWEALPAAAIGPGQRARFVQLRTRIDEVVRAGSEAEQRQAQWLAQARRALAEGNRAALAAAQAGARTDIAELRLSTVRLLAARPDAPATASLGVELDRLLDVAGGVERRLAWLDAAAERADAAPPLAKPSAGLEPASQPDVPLPTTREPKPGPDAGPATGPGPEPEPDTGLLTEPGPEPGAETGPGTGSGPEPEPEPDAGLQTEPGPEPAVDTGPSTGSGSQAPRDAGLEPDADLRGFLESGGQPGASFPPAGASTTALPPAVEPPAQVDPPRPALPSHDDWRALPPVADLAIAQVLEARWQRWVAALRAVPAQVDATTDTLPARRPPRHRALDADTLARASALATQAEQALADGRLSDAQQRLQQVDSLLHGSDAGAVPALLRTRLQTVRSETVRLRGWQHWGGTRARDELVASAEDLARRATATPEGADAQPLKLNLKEHAEALQDLRRRWKMLDGMGAAASAPQWQSFDVALQAAHAPLAARQAVLQAAREQNLAARLPLLEALEALTLPPDPGAALGAVQGLPPVDGATAEPDVQPSPAPNATPDSPSDSRPNAVPDAVPDAAAPAAPHAASDAAPHAESHAAFDGPSNAAPLAATADSNALDWKSLLREFDRLQSAWRKLGPLEHTIPTAAREGLGARHRRAITRVEAPLAEARRAATAERERLVQAAEGLLAGMGTESPGLDTIALTRRLQADWQTCARGVPLPRAVEHVLWLRFKAATDAVFKQRAAAAAARGAQAQTRLLADAAAAQASTGRLDAIAEHTPASEIQAALSETDVTWRQLGDLPRERGIAAAYRAARERTVQLLAAARHREDQARWDALVDRLTRCEQREDAQDATDATPQSVVADGAWPAAWSQALARRESRGPAPGPLQADAVDDLLLQLEAASDLPAEPQWVAARRTLKLRALKEAMEGRGAAASTLRSPAEALPALIGQSGLTADQRRRLHALLSAWRAAQPGPGSARALLP